jgi:hypothetical protein
VQQPGINGSPAQSAAIRIAALVQAASSYARAMLQWQPEQGEGISGAGLWTATNNGNGGKPTILANLLPQVLEVLRYPVRLMSGQPIGVLVADGQGGSIAINVNPTSVTAMVSGVRTALEPGQVRVRESP